jgi:hypothetical protein
MTLRHDAEVRRVNRTGIVGGPTQVLPGVA